MTKILKRPLSILLAVLMIAGVFAALPLTAYAAELATDTTTWETGDYVVPADGVTISGHITVNGTVNLTLTEGTTLTANMGITISDGATLNVSGEGTMVVNGSNNNTGSTVAGSGNLVLTNGTLTATGGNGGSGGPMMQSPGGAGGAAISGNVTVNGGTLTATGGNGGSGDSMMQSPGGAGGVSYSGTLTLGVGVKLYEGTNNSGTLLDGNDSSSRTYNDEKKQNMYAEAQTHIHDFTYSASGSTITATCGTQDGCTLPPSTEGGSDHVATLTIAAPTSLSYDGTAKAAVITDANSIKGDATIQYQTKSGDTYGTATTTAPTDAGDYKASITVGGATASVEYTIAKAEPTATEPTATATYGQTLADVTLTNPEGNTDGTWAWVNAGTTSVGDVGSHNFKANFTPSDTTNYNGKTNVDVTVTVSKAANPATVTNTASVTKGSNTVDLANNVTKNGATGDVTYAISGEANGCSLNGSVLTSGNNTGSVTVNVTVATDDNYNALATTPITVTINDKQTQTITAENVTANYGDTDKKVTATTNGNGTITYTVKDGSADFIDVNASTGALTIKKVGSATVIVTAAETDTYAQATKEVTVTINKANAVAATVTANNRTYDGAEKPLVTVTGTPTGGNMQYALGTNATTAPDASAYTTDIPTKTDAGTYYVWYKVVGDDNHNDSQPVHVEAKINPVDKTDLTTAIAAVKDYYDTIKDNDDFVIRRTVLSITRLL